VNALGAPGNKVNGPTRIIKVEGHGATGERTKNAEGNWDDSEASHTSASGPAPGGVPYDELQRSAGELESLSPQRRAIVIRYFRLMRPAPESQPSLQENKK
jgi:hypothetical protein